MSIKTSFRRAIYFALSVFIVLEVANFPLPINFSKPVGGWKVVAFDVSVVNLVIGAAAFAVGILVLPMLKSRFVSVARLVVAGIISGVELLQFEPFSAPFAFPGYILVCGLAVSIVPMAITLFLTGYVFSKKKELAATL